MGEPGRTEVSSGGPAPEGSGPSPAQSWHAPRMYPDTYPGAAPAHHYLLLDGEVHQITLPDGDLAAARLVDGRAVDAVLGAAGLPPLSERIPVLAYGANRNPHTLDLKFEHYDYRTDGTSTTVPVLAGTLRDLDVVASGLSSQGCLYADLTPSPGVTTHVHVALFDVDQTRVVHESEGVGRGGYDCARIAGFAVDDGPITLEPLGYVGTRPVFVSPATGEPVAFAAIAADGRNFGAMDQLDAMSHLIESCELSDELARLLGLDPGAGPGDQARELIRVLSGAWWYVHNTGDEPPRIVRAIQRLVGDAIEHHRAPISTSRHFEAAGRLVDAATAFAADGGSRLAAQLA